jgi:hypothetical protein
MSRDWVNKNKTDLFVTQNQESQWVLGLRLKTGYGFIKPIKVKEYPIYSQYIEFLKLQGWEVSNFILRAVKGSVIEESVKQDLTRSTFLSAVQNNVYRLRNQYLEIFNIFVDDFDDKYLYSMTQQEFDDFRRLILSFNGVNYIEANPNPKIQRFNIMKMIISKSRGSAIDFDTIHSSLGVGCGYKPHDINDFTLYQFYLYFKRLELFKMHDVTTLYKTVDAKDSIKVIDWFKSTRETEEEEFYNSTEQLQQNNVFLKGKK